MLIAYMHEIAEAEQLYFSYMTLPLRIKQLQKIAVSSYIFPTFSPFSADKTDLALIIGRVFFPQGPKSLQFPGSIFTPALK